jgi:hypothetical protein
MNLEREKYSEPNDSLGKFLVLVVAKKSDQIFGCQQISSLPCSERETLGLVYVSKGRWQSSMPYFLIFEGNAEWFLL